MVKEKLCRKVMARWMHNKVMKTVLVYEEDALPMICGFVPQSRKCLKQKNVDMIS